MTNVVIAGGHGQIALHLQRLLAEAGHSPAGIIRNPEQVGELQGIGSRAIVLDLEHSSANELADELDGVDVVVFAVGDGAILLAEAAQLAKVPRYIMVSAMAADDFDADSDDVFQVYLRAKSEADADLRGRDLDWTIVRPGGLTDDAATGLITAATSTGRGSIPRADVAGVLFSLIESGAASRTQFEVIEGTTPIPEALAAL
ncbi:NAD(P)-binding oxidoreductase [Plantibacter sp. RU18]|uniref:NAD(P)-binding oxidoreductase n=1 Tax=Plantibacter sp. RU18 TaxID=3158143 RepID=UPI003D35BF50